MKPFSDSPHDGADQNGRDAQSPRPTAQSIQAQQRREAIERSRVERLLHAKADGQISEAETVELTRLTSDHARFAGEVKRSRLALDHLTILPPAPDFTNRVLDHCSDTIQFTTKPKRRTIRRERLALAACSLVLIIALVSTHRYWPGWTRSSASSEPLAKVLGAGQQDLASSFAAFANSGKLLAGEVSTRLATIPQSTMTPAIPVAPRAVARDTRLKLGNTSRFEKPVTGAVSGMALMASQSGLPDPSRYWMEKTDLFRVDDQWVLAGLSPRELASSHTPVMSQIISHYAPYHARLSNGWRAPSETIDEHFPKDSYPHPSYSEWPLWPNLAD